MGLKPFHAGVPVLVPVGSGSSRICEAVTAFRRGPTRLISPRTSFDDVFAEAVAGEAITSCSRRNSSLRQTPPRKGLRSRQKTPEKEARCRRRFKSRRRSPPSSRGGYVWPRRLSRGVTRMFLTRRPSRQTIERFVDESRRLPLSYNQVGIAEAPPADYDLDEIFVTIGHGQAGFERAKAALAAWKHFDINWVETSPRAASIEPGSVVAVLIRHLGFWSLNGCRVVYGLGDRLHGPTFGFAYGNPDEPCGAGRRDFRSVSAPANA
jgi:uncharacterized protein (UPF0548 family)